MTASSQTTKRKLSPRALAEELRIVSRACRLMGNRRESLHEIRTAFRAGALEALVESKRGPQPPHTNRVSPEIGEKILELSLMEPTHGAQSVSAELRSKGIDVGVGGVRAVWRRHSLETTHQRLLRLEEAGREGTIALSDEQIRLLERHSVDFRFRHVAKKPGELLNQDTFYWGTLRGAGKVYVQVAVDLFCSLAFAQVYDSKVPITACGLLYDRVLPFYEELGVEVGSVLTDNGREFCGRADQHPYELLLAVEGIEHKKTKLGARRTPGVVDRTNRTLLEECFRAPGRTTWYADTSEIQRDLDVSVEEYNLRRSHQGYRLSGRTPAQALCEALGVADLPPLIPVEDEEEDPARSSAARSQPASVEARS